MEWVTALFFLLHVLETSRLHYSAPQALLQDFLHVSQSLMTSVVFHSSFLIILVSKGWRSIQWSVFGFPRTSARSHRVPQWVVALMRVRQSLRRVSLRNLLLESHFPNYMCYICALLCRGLYSRYPVLCPFHEGRNWGSERSIYF